MLAITNTPTKANPDRPDRTTHVAVGSPLHLHPRSKARDSEMGRVRTRCRPRTTTTTIKVHPGKSRAKNVERRGWRVKQLRGVLFPPVAADHAIGQWRREVVGFLCCLFALSSCTLPHLHPRSLGVRYLGGGNQPLQTGDPSWHLWLETGKGGATHILEAVRVTPQRAPSCL